MGNSERVTASYAFEDADELYLESGVHCRVPEAGSTIAPLFLMNSSLGSGTKTRGDLLRCFQRVMEFLQSTTPMALFLDLFACPRAARAVVDQVSHVEHVGLIIPPCFLDDLAWAGATAGFKLEPAIFPSVLVARELGRLMGRESVKTTVFKASAEATAGAVVRCEAFIPTDVDDEIVRGWIAENVATHVAVRVNDLTSLAKLEAIFASEGYVMPPFMNGKPIVNGVEHVTVMYFDGMCRGRHLRVECYCEGVA